MPGIDNSPKIFTPNNLHDLLSLASEYPDSLLFAGGTSIMQKWSKPEFELPEYIIDCGKIEDLKKIKRTERYLEVGALVPLSKIIGIGIHVIPKGLYQAVSLTAIPTIRQLATIGGNIYIGSPYSGILTVLYAMDSFLELRSFQKSMWVSLSELIIKTEKQRNLIPPGYILTRIRIPLGNWNHQIFKKIARKKSQAHGSLTFCGLAKTSKGILTDIRLCFGSLGNHLFRHRGFEAGMLGRKLPFNTKSIDTMISQLNQLLHPITDRYSTSEYRKTTSMRLVQWFLEELGRILI
ncbi:MAG: FAD binding domain-containing protein [Spirochaetales bacterium]|nr:FAD binding domain-containing protein [Spirochaetales bacterium]